MWIPDWQDISSAHFTSWWQSKAIFSTLLIVGSIWVQWTLYLFVCLLYDIWCIFSVLRSIRHQHASDDCSSWNNENYPVCQDKAYWTSGIFGCTEIFMATFPVTYLQFEQQTGHQHMSLFNYNDLDVPFKETFTTWDFFFFFFLLFNINWKFCFT